MGTAQQLTWFVTGTSRGFGLEIARAALARGDRVVAAARDPQAVTRALGTHEHLLPVALDVADERQAEAAVAAALARFGRLDVHSLVRTRRTIDDYAASSGATREWAADTNHAQAGDPAKAAAAIVWLATTAAPPLRLQLGGDCVARVEAKLASVRAELDRFRDIALSTGYDAADTAQPGGRAAAR